MCACTYAKSFVLFVPIYMYILFRLYIIYIYSNSVLAFWASSVLHVLMIRMKVTVLCNPDVSGMWDAQSKPECSNCKQWACALCISGHDPPIRAQKMTKGHRMEEDVIAVTYMVITQTWWIYHVSPIPCVSVKDINQFIRIIFKYAKLAAIAQVDSFLYKANHMHECFTSLHRGEASSFNALLVNTCSSCSVLQK